MMIHGNCNVMVYLFHDFLGCSYCMMNAKLVRMGLCWNLVVSDVHYLTIKLICCTPATNLSKTKLLKPRSKSSVV